MILIAQLDLKKSIYQLSLEHPTLASQLSMMGFTEITKPGMLDKVGRYMTLELGCKLRKINFKQVKLQLITLGYEIKEEPS